MLHNSSISLSGFNISSAYTFLSSISLILVLQSTSLWNMISTFSPYLNLIYPSKYQSNLTSLNPSLTLSVGITVFSEFLNYFSGAMHYKSAEHKYKTLSLTFTSHCPRSFSFIYTNETNKNIPQWKKHCQ